MIGPVPLGATKIWEWLIDSCVHVASSWKILVKRILIGVDCLEECLLQSDESISLSCSLLLWTGTHVSVSCSTAPHSLLSFLVAPCLYISFLPKFSLISVHDHTMAIQPNGLPQEVFHVNIPAKIVLVNEAFFVKFCSQYSKGMVYGCPLTEQINNIKQRTEDQVWTLEKSPAPSH